MKVAVIRTEREITNVIAKAFEKSGCDLLAANEYLMSSDEYDAVVVYGFLRGPGEVLKHCIRTGKEFFYVDHAYINSSHGYKGNKSEWKFRIIRNNYYPELGNTDPDKFNKAYKNVKLKKWNYNKNGVILYCPPSDNALNFFKNAREANRRIINNLSGKRYIERKKSFRKLPPIDWGRIRLLVTYNSSLAIEAMINGVPFYTEQAGKELRTEISDIDNPNMQDRMPMIYSIVNSQYTVAEITAGKWL